MNFRHIHDEKSDYDDEKHHSEHIDLIQGIEGMRMEIDGNYLSTPAEITAAVDGVRRIISGVEKGYFTESSYDSSGLCPRNMVLSTIGLLTRVYESLAIILALMKAKQNFYSDTASNLDHAYISHDEESNGHTFEREKLLQTVNSWEPLLTENFSVEVDELA